MLRHPLRITLYRRLPVSFANRADQMLTQVRASVDAALSQPLSTDLRAGVLLSAADLLARNHDEAGEREMWRKERERALVRGDQRAAEIAVWMLLQNLEVNHLYAEWRDLAREVKDNPATSYFTRVRCP